LAGIAAHNFRKMGSKYTYQYVKMCITMWKILILIENQ